MYLSFLNTVVVNYCMVNAPGLMGSIKTEAPREFTIYMFNDFLLDYVNTTYNIYM